jgi:hypothetical protein
MNNPETQPRLLRKMNLLDATFLVIGSVVGSGIFMTSGLIAGYLPSPTTITAPTPLWEGRLHMSDFERKSGSRCNRSWSYPQVIDSATRPVIYFWHG